MRLLKQDRLTTVLHSLRSTTHLPLSNSALSGSICRNYQIFQTSKILIQFQNLHQNSSPLEEVGVVEVCHFHFVVVVIAAFEGVVVVVVLRSKR